MHAALEMRPSSVQPIFPFLIVTLSSPTCVFSPFFIFSPLWAIFTLQLLQPISLQLFQPISASQSSAAHFRSSASYLVLLSSSCTAASYTLFHPSVKSCVFSFLSSSISSACCFSSLNVINLLPVTMRIQYQPIKKNIFRKK